MGLAENIGSLEFEAVDKVIYQWLNLMNTLGVNGWEGYALHVANILATGTAEHTLQTNFQGVNISPKAIDVINKMYEYVRDPNIDGIVIHAESETGGRDIDTSQRIVLSVENDDKDSTTKKQYIVDNAVPKLRTWEINGYLITSSILLRGLTVKDDLILKLSILDSYSKSRLPVLFKSCDMRFQKVLITHYDYEYDPKATNAVHIKVQLQEYKTVDVTSTKTELRIRAIEEQLKK